MNTNAGYGVGSGFETNIRIIGKQKNVDFVKIISGKPLFVMDIKRERMLITMIVHPPAFGMKVKSVNDAWAREMPGIKDVFQVKVHNDDFVRVFLIL